MKKRIINCSLCKNEVTTNSGGQKYCVVCSKIVRKDYKKKQESLRRKKPGIKERIRTIQKNWVLKNRELISKRSKEARLALRIEVLNFYGGFCNCCKESHPNFLAIDHINNDGAKHRKEIGKNGGSAFYLWIKKNNFPEGFQVLCHNCNMAKGFYGKCPHTK